MPDLDRITITIESLPEARAQVHVNMPPPLPGMRLETPAHALAIDAVGWLGKQPTVAGLLYGMEPAGTAATSRESHFFLAGWNGAVLNVDATDYFQKALASAPQCVATPAANAPVMLPEPDGAIKEVMGLVDSLGVAATCFGVYRTMNNPEQSSAMQEAKEFHRKIETKLRALLATSGRAQAGQHPDDVAVDALAALMKAKLAKQRAKEYGGWDTDCTRERLSELLRGHVEKGDPVDVANFCAFLSARGEGIAPQQADARDAESDYRRGYRHGYNRRDAEVQGALL